MKINPPENINAPCLVQRLEIRKYPGDTAKGVDRYFSMDYMGSAEFEFGTLPNTMKVVRATPRVGPVELRAVRDGQPVTAWYVGPEDQRASAEWWFTYCVARKDNQYNLYMKEMPRVFDAYQPVNVTPPRGSKSTKRRAIQAAAPYETKYVGWWCVDAGDNFCSRGPGCWAIFREKGHADNWLKGINEKG